MRADPLDQASPSRPALITVYCPLSDGQRERSREVARVSYDGFSGEITLFDETRAEELESVFEREHIRLRCVTGPDGAQVAFPPENLPPWQPQTLRYVCDVVLPAHQLKAEINRRGSHSETCEAVVATIADQSVLATIARTEGDEAMRVAAVDRLLDQAVLTEVVDSDAVWEVRSRALRKLSDQTTLARIAQSHPNQYTREEAVKRVADHTVLATVSDSDKVDRVRRTATAALAKLQPAIAIQKELAIWGQPLWDSLTEVGAEHGILVDRDFNVLALERDGVGSSCAELNQAVAGILETRGRSRPVDLSPVRQQFQEAIGELESCTDLSGLLRRVVDVSAPYVERAAILLVHRDKLVGVHSQGLGSAEEIKRLSILCRARRCFDWPSCPAERYQGAR